MQRSRLAIALLAIALLATACGGVGVPTTEALLAPSTEPPVTTPPKTAVTEVSPPLVPAGCAVFDSDELGILTPIGRSLALVESRSESENLTCNFVGTADGLDTGVRIQVDLLAAHSADHFSVAGQFESLQTLAGIQGISFGRGSFRAALDGERGMTIVVTIRKLSSSAVAPRDGEFLDIRNNIVVFVIDALN